nr:retrovirus-related Pol polyprotein from transposon TNT 1-94 [Tanacetum cinerariifolium]
MSSCKPVPTPLTPHFKLSSHECPKSEEDKEDMSRVSYSIVVGSLMYAMVCTRPDLAHVVSVVSRYMHNPGKMHWKAVKCILLYLKGTTNIGLSFEKGCASPNGVVGYVDSDYAGDLDARKSLSSYMFSHCGSAISWHSSLQAITALSTTEAETERVKEAIWLRGMVKELVYLKRLVAFLTDRSPFFPSCGLSLGLDPLSFLVGGSSSSLGSSLGLVPPLGPFAFSLCSACAPLLCSCRLLSGLSCSVCLLRRYDDVGCLLALVLFHALPLSISLMHTYTGRRSPGSSLFTSGFILKVGVGSIYISPPLYPGPAGLAGSKNCPPMLNNENYVPWSSRLLREEGQVVQRWEKFTSTDGESIESYYHRFLKLMNDLKRNKHFPEKIASNLKFLNNLQPEWSRHVTIVHQTKDLHTADYTQLYDFLKYNQKEVDDLKAERLERTQDPLALMATSNNPYTFLVLHQDQPSFNQNYMKQPMPNPEDITDPTTAMNMSLALMAKAFKLNYSTPTNNNHRISSNPRNRQIAQRGMNMGQDRQMQMVVGNGGNQFRQYAGQNVGNLNGYNDVQNVGNQGIQNAVQNPRIQNVGNQNGLIVVPRNANQNPNRNGNLVAARDEGNATGHNGIQLQAEEFDLMAAAIDLGEIEEVNANCILMANLQQASTSGTQTDKALVYDSDGSAEVQNYENCYDNEIFNMFTQEEQYTELLEPIPEPHQVPQNDNNVIFEVSSMEQSGGTVEQHPANVEETHLNKQLLVEKSIVSFLLEEKKKLKSDFKIREDGLLDKQIQLEKKIKELDNILVKTGQSIQTINMLSPKLDAFYHTEQKMALGYQNPFYLKQAQQKQQSLYDEKVLFEKHDPPVVHDSEETLQLAQESRQKMKQLNKEIKPANYTKINHLLGVFISQMAKSREELYF